jgi:hypothetical protein
VVVMLLMLVVSVIAAVVVLLSRGWWASLNQFNEITLVFLACLGGRKPHHQRSICFHLPKDTRTVAAVVVLGL